MSSTNGKRPYPDPHLNDTVPKFCKDCAKYASCNLYHDEHLRDECSLLKDDAPITYRNSEGYADPTTFYALRNVEREKKRKTKGTPDRRKEQHKPDPSKPRHNTQVVHY